MAEILIFEFQNNLIFILLSLFSFLCYFFIFKKPKNSRKLVHGCDLPPSPPSLPIIGHLHLILSRLMHKSLQKLSSKYGPLLHLRIFNAPIVLVSSASMAYEFFRTQDINVSCRSLPVNDQSLLFGDFSFIPAPYGDYWRFMKKLMVTKLFGAQAHERSRGIRADELQRFYTTLLVKSMRDEKIEIGDEVTKLTNNIICKMTMGRSCSEENGEADIVRGLVAESDAMTKKLFIAAVLRKPLEKLGISLFKTDVMDLSRRYEQVLERILKEHEEKPEEHQNMDMMDVLVEAYRDKNAEYKITRNHIKAFFTDLLIAGTDTLAETIQWTMAEIINSSKILERLREEIESVVGKTRLIQETDLPNLPYLKAVVKEGLRLHPPLPLIPRNCRKGCKIGGFYVAEKTTFVVNVYAVMRDPEYWETPEEFKPERFLGCSREGEFEDEKEKILRYIPFGGGRRGCPGANLASVSVGIIVGMMIHCFDWKINGEKVKMEEAAGVMTLSMAYPLICTPIARTPTINFDSH